VIFEKTPLFVFELISITVRVLLSADHVFAVMQDQRRKNATVFLEMT